MQIRPKNYPMYSKRLTKRKIIIRRTNKVLTKLFKVSKQNFSSYNYNNGSFIIFFRPNNNFSNITKEATPVNLYCRTVVNFTGRWTDYEI